MKKLLSIISILVPLFMPFAAHADITTGLLDYYKVDEGSGSTATDSGSQAFNATTHASPTYSAGKIGPYSMTFNGTTQYAETTSNIGVSGSAARTVSFWVKSTTATPAANMFVVNINDITSGANALFAIRADSTSKTWKFTDGSTPQDTTTALTTNWIQIVATLNGSNVLNVYANGAITSVASVTLSSINTTNGKFVFGDQGPGTSGFFSGSIDDIRVYNRALSSSDVAQLYAYTGLNYQSFTVYVGNLFKIFKGSVFNVF